jgi:aryl-alcohol dehydrogenase-like predicted oxidoreductase
VSIWWRIAVSLLGQATLEASQVALRWLIENPVVIPIPGAKNGAQAEENAGALSFALMGAEVAALDRATQAWRK